MDKNNRVTSNLIWRLLERFGAQGVTFLVSIILARVLDPEIYGKIALITVITSILQVFVDGGFSSALIQKKDADDMDFSTVFYFNLVICVVLYVGLFFLAPFISRFYEMDDLTPVIRVLGLVLIISGVKSVQISYVSRHLQFKKFFFATLGGTIVAAGVGIWMAYSGYGVWALVAQNLVNQTIDTTILWIIVKWKPKFVFSFQRLKKLFGFGWKMLASGLLDRTYYELRSLIIGKKYSSADLAFYNKADQFPNLIATNVNASIDSVLLPVMSNEQDDKERVKIMTRRAIKTTSFVLWPLMMGLAACSTALISLLLTDKWLPAAPYMMIFCITYGFYPIHTANLNAIKAMGRSDIFLKLEVIKKIIGLSIIAVTMWFGVIWIALGMIVASIACQIINSWPNKKLLNYSYFEQLKDILPSIALSLLMGGVVYCINFLNLANWLTLLIQIHLAIIIYVLGAWLFKMESFTYCLNILKGLLHRKKKVEVTQTAEDIQNENDTAIEEIHKDTIIEITEKANGEDGRD
ncbi:MAG: lipopolysaccharide biosynthesis protein [Clostridia bacterium]|nr:lipopolysaccharide biosynthesis protein [Clostridia bacterium]